jgi:hypothetical protein
MVLRKLLSAGIIGAGLGVFAPAAMADCTGQPLQTITNRFFALNDTSLKPGPISAALKADVAACPNDPFAHKIVALAHVNMTTRPNLPAAEALAYASEAFAALRVMNANMPSDGGTRTVLEGKGSPVVIELSDSYDVSKRIVETLLVAEALAGRVADSNPPPKPGDKPVNCDVYQTSITQQVMFWIREKQDSPGGMNILDRTVANCTGNEFNRATAHINRAKTIMGMLKRKPDRPDAAQLVQRAYADVAAFTAVRPSGGMDWGSYDQSELSRMAWAALASSPGASLPADQWFTPANINKPLTNMSIAAALDAAYAKDVADAGTGVNTYPTYRAVISNAFAKINTFPAGQQRDARKSLHFAAKMHAEGTWRGEANKGLKKPADYFYNWVDPDYKPPAAPTAAAPPAAQ